MNLDDFLNALKADPELREGFEVRWEESLQSLPTERLPFLDRESLKESALVP